MKNKRTSELYFAYGSNLSKKQISDRCPSSEYICRGKFHDYKWIIYERGFANVVKSPGDYVLGEIFLLSESDVKLLDSFESVQKGLYQKETHSIETANGNMNCFIYIDSNTEIGTPSEEYVLRINRGIAESSLPLDYVNKYIRPYIPKGKQGSNLPFIYQD